MNEYQRPASPAEKVYLTLDCTKFLAVTGPPDSDPITITDDTSTTVEVYLASTAVPDALATDRVITGSVIGQLIDCSALTAGNTYEVRFTVSRSDGLIHQESHLLKVRVARSVSFGKK